MFLYALSSESSCPRWSPVVKRFLPSKFVAISLVISEFDFSTLHFDFTNIDFSGLMKWNPRVLHHGHSRSSEYELKYCVPLFESKLITGFEHALQLRRYWQHGNAANTSYLYKVPICSESPPSFCHDWSQWRHFISPPWSGDDDESAMRHLRQMA